MWLAPRRLPLPGCRSDRTGTTSRVAEADTVGVLAGSAAVLPTRDVEMRKMQPAPSAWQCVPVQGGRPVVRLAGANSFAGQSQLSPAPLAEPVAAGILAARAGSSALGGSPAWIPRSVVLVEAGGWTQNLAVSWSLWLRTSAAARLV